MKRQSELTRPRSEAGGFERGRPNRNDRRRGRRSAGQRDPVLGLASARGRPLIRGGRRLRVAAFRSSHRYGCPDDHRGVADRWIAFGDPRFGRLWAREGGLRRRLVVRLRLFSRRALVGRGGMPGRWGQVPVGAAAGGRRAAGGVGLFSRLRLCALRPSLVVRAVADPRAGVQCGRERVDAGPHVHRLPVERHRHGARGESHFGADRLSGRPARAHLRYRGNLRCARHALARTGRRAGADGHCRTRAARNCGVRRRPAGRAGEPDRPRRPAAVDAARRRAGRVLRAGEQGRHRAALSRVVRAATARWRGSTRAG